MVSSGRRYSIIRRMKNKDNWEPSKFIYRKGRLIASRNNTEVAVGSRLITDIVANFYAMYLPQCASGKLLDLGCGEVPLYQVYKDFVSENICVDWGNTKHKNKYLDCVCDLNHKLPFKDDEFDTILLSDVLEHIARPESLWAEMSKILSPKGRIVGNTPFFYGLHETPYDYYRYTEYSLKRFAELSGFKLIVLQSIGGTPEILADIIAKQLQFLPVLGKSIANVIQLLASAFVKTSVGKKISERTGMVFPLGYFFLAEKV